eukprot:7378244-Prymnesium_polylepis.1
MRAEEGQGAYIYSCSCRTRLSAHRVRFRRGRGRLGAWWVTVAPAPRHPSSADALARSGHLRALSTVTLSRSASRRCV